MMNAPKIKHPLKHDGVSQVERLLTTLMPENVKIDARSLQDIISATNSYAKYLQFFDKEDHSDGDWSCFWEVEPLTFLAIISSIDTKSILTEYQQKRNAFDRLSEEELDEATQANHALELINYIKKQAKKVEHYYRLLPENLPLKKEILALIRRDSQLDTEQLAGALHTLIGYHKEAYPRTLDNPKNLFHCQYAFFFGSHWGIKDEADFYSNIPFSTDYIARGFEKLDDVLKVFHRALVKIKQRANHWFSQNIENPQVREPHVALYLTFLRLFEFARTDLNDLSRQHLEFYFERVLHLKGAEAVPDEVHLIFELANNVDQYLIEKGTELLAGKDTNSRPLIFRALEDWVINKAKVKELKNAYLNLEGPGQLLVNPNVAKKYCAQKELPNEKASSWRVMGDDPELPYGELGFAVASPQLILREGKRIIHLNFSNFIKDNAPSELFRQPDVFQLYLSGKEGWMRVPLPVNANESGYSIAADDALKFTIVLLEDFPSIDTPVQALYDSPWPAIKLVLNNEHPEFSNVYQLLTGGSILKLELNVSVEGIKENLIVQSDLGVFDGVQKFYPFGPIPEANDKFYIGSTEIFQKSLEKLTVHFEWVDPPVNFTTHYQNYIRTNDSDLPSPAINIALVDSANLNSNNIWLPEVAITRNGDRESSVSGIITDLDGNPLIGVLIKEEGTSSGTVSSREGTYSIDVSSDEAILTFSDKKLGTVTIGVEGAQEINVILENGISRISIIDENTIRDSLEIQFLPVLPRDVRSQQFSAFSPSLNRGFVSMELEGDFWHEEYRKSLILKSIEAANGDAVLRDSIERIQNRLASETEEGNENIAIEKIDSVLSISRDSPLPNEPYTPATNGISLDYDSNQTISIGSENDGIDQFFHILPFNGYREVELNREDSDGIPLLYPYPAFDRGSTDFAPGNLFIGLEKVQPGANLSLLIQILEGSEAEPDWQSPDIRWSYLTEFNQWAPFTAEQILKDSTFGLTRTGMIQLMIPTDIVNETTLFEGALYWLRVAAIEDTDTSPPKSIRALPRVVKISAQAVEARFEDQANDLAHLAKPLPAGQVTKLLQSQSEIKKIEQPFPSRKGQLPEKGNTFYRRVSERLRHKDRAVTIWDYERILLEAFPKIFRAKCLSHTRLTSELAPGHTLVAVIPDLSRRQSEYPVAPRFSAGDLAEMANYLRYRTNLFVAHTTEDDIGNIQEQYLWIANPIYEPVRLKFDVRFKRGVDVNFHMYLLDDDLKHFLAPWVKDQTANIRFNQMLHRSRIIQFIEERPYVDVVLNLEVEHCGIQLPAWQSEIIPTTSRSILTTHLAEGKDPLATDHEIRTFPGGDPAPC